MIAAASSNDDGPGSGHGAPGLGAIEPATVAALRDALRGYLLGTVPDAESALAAALRSLSTEARTRDVSAERIVILIKGLWYDLPEVRAATLQRQHSLLAQIVTLCIRTYYAHNQSR